MANSVLGTFQFDSVIRGIFANCIRQDAEISDIADLVHPSTVYRSLVHSFIATKTKNETLHSTHRTLAMLGFIGSRNFLIGSHLYYLQNNNWPAFGGKKDPNLVDYCKRGLRLEEYCIKNSIPGKESAFIVGVLFDAIELLHGASLGKGAVEKEWQNGFQKASAVLALAKDKPALHDSPGLFAAALLPALANLVATLGDPLLTKFNAGEIACMISRLSGACSSWEAALFFLSNPSLALGRDPLSRDAASLMHIAYHAIEPKSQPWATRLRLAPTAWAEAQKALSQARI